MKTNEPLGIPSESIGVEYLQIAEGQDITVESLKTVELLRSIMENETIPEFQGKNKSIQFINWGFTELVYVLRVGDRRYTVLVRTTHNRIW